MASFPDVRSLGDALPTVGDSSYVESKSTPVEIKVLSWNINGEGMAELRNRLVPAVVRKISPAIVLLQETTTDKLVKSIEAAGRSYVEVRAGDKTESRVLYDGKKYEAISNDQKLFPGEEGGAISLTAVFKLSIERVFPEGEERELRSGRAEGMKELFKKRISIVGLKRKDYPDFVFMSYHNVNTRQGKDVREKAAKSFCRIVSIIRKMTGCIVVAGADLNYQIDKSDAHPGCKIPAYDPTPRRQTKKIIDYFIIAPDTVEAYVEPLDFVGAPDDTTNPLHQVIGDILRPKESIPLALVPTLHSLSQATPKVDHGCDIGRAVDHDPLLCEIKITI